MKSDLPKAYDPKAIETKQYEFWLERGYFEAVVEPGRPHYCITIPPPNVTGELHMGHALQHSIHDLIIRWKRMQGLNTLCLPGTDHASISTQMKVVQQLQREGLSRHDLGREKFVERCWQWTEKYGGTILAQLRALGCSYDWRRTRFTLDDAYCRAVLTAFVRFYERGWIYRGHRVIQWCPDCQTTVSDLEVIHKEVASSLWHLRYPVVEHPTRCESGIERGPLSEQADGEGEVVVATTRPETMLGDTAVAVHPGDERYKALVGREVILPLMNRRIRVVADEHVDPEFGTGAVKVTPAHDPNDFEIGQRHGLPQVVVIGTDGKMTAEAGAYAGLDRFEARRRVVEELEAGGFLVKIEEYTHPVGHCERSETVLEPLLMEQWFVKMRELADRALEQIRSGKVRFIPERFAGQTVQWLENIRDWNISRQLWWGQRIPVWTCEGCGQLIVRVDPPESCPGCGSDRLRQDEDVLDTWFSSALWPFATLGWPEQTPELEYFYPTDLMITARDILYLWIARMMYCSQEFMGAIPFRDVFVHPTVQTHEGRRMSKSLGTGIDPMDLTDRYGTDATRFGLVYQCGGSQDIRFTEERLEMARNFCNKLWNASRFVLMNLGDPVLGARCSVLGSEPSVPPSTEHRAPSTAGRAVPGAEEMATASGRELADRWILSRLQRTVERVTQALESYALDEAAQTIYSFVWDEFCDWYVELAKPRLNAPGALDVRGPLLYTLETILRLAHPFMPFITEAIWQSLPVGRTPHSMQERHRMGAPIQATGESLMIAAYPTTHVPLIDVEAEQEMERVIEITRAIRNLRAEMKVPPSQRIEAAVIAPNAPIDGARGYIEALARVTLSDTRPEQAVTALAAGAEIALAAGTLLNPAEELAGVEKEIAALRKDLERVEGKLGNEQFLARAPEAIVAKERRIQDELTGKLAKLEERRKMLAS